MAVRWKQRKVISVILQGKIIIIKNIVDREISPRAEVLSILLRQQSKWRSVICLQFEAVPLNICVNKKADYVVTGNFAKKAFKEAGKFTDAVCAASSEEKNFTYIPKLTAKDFRSDADYVHICFNNTIFGTHYNYVPDTAGIPLVADMSSCILSEEVDVSKFGVIYAGAQKNVIRLAYQTIRFSFGFNS